MARGGWLVVVLFGWASSASAQVVPPPPPAYASASIGLDVVLEPLVTAAEADVASGRYAMALGRTQAVLSEAPASSAVHVRAEGLALLARQRLGDQPAGTVAADEAYAPLVAAASDDVTASRFDLARARLGWVLLRVPADGALAVRAHAIGAALEQRASSPVATTSPAIRVPPSGAVWATPALPSTARQPSADPTRRTDAEIVDLYVTGGLMGVYLGSWILVGTDALNGMSSRDAELTLAGTMLAGAGVMTLATFALDQIDHGPRAGQPSAIAGGMRFGFVLAGLTLGTLVQDHGSWGTAEHFDALGIGLLGGATIGAILAYTANPHPSQTQFTQATGVWGAMLGAELGALIAPLAFPNSGATTERWQTGFGLPLGGLSVGLATGLLLSAAHEHFSARRSWLTTLGLVCGTAGGTLIWMLVSAGERWTFDLPTWGGIAGVGGLGGLILAAALTGGDRGSRDWEDETPPPQLSIAPTTGGATIGVNGTF